jgi:two-component system chemotaxis response regulator CheB
VVIMSRQHRDLIVVGASAGGVEALRSLVAGIAPDLPAAIAVVLHLPADGTSALPQILSRFGPLPAVAAADEMPIRPGRIHVAPPDHHLLVVEDQFMLSRSPTENGHRPSINALFRSAAITFGPRVTGVLLSGVLDDGVAGLVAIHLQGGRTVVQDPADALHPGMPKNALRHLVPDHVLATAAMGATLDRLTRQDVDPGPFPLAGRGEDFERALWNALRSLDEKADLAARMCDEARRRGNERLADRYARTTAEATEAADVLRERLTATPSQPIRRPGQ